MITFGKVKEMIDQKKTELREYQNKRDAHELQKLRKERITQEGRARLRNTRLKEMNRIEKARADQKKFKEEVDIFGRRKKKKKEEKRREFGSGINPAFGNK